MAVTTSEIRSPLGKFPYAEVNSPRKDAMGTRHGASLGPSSHVSNAYAKDDSEIARCLDDDPQMKDLIRLATQITTGKHPRLPPIDKLMSSTDSDVIGFLSWEQNGQPKVLYPDDPQVKELKQVVIAKGNPILVNGSQNVASADVMLPPPPLASEPPVPLPGKYIDMMSTPAANPPSANTTPKYRTSPYRDRFKIERRRLEESLERGAAAEKPNCRDVDLDLYELEKKCLPDTSMVHPLQADPRSEKPTSIIKPLDIGRDATSLNGDMGSKDSGNKNLKQSVTDRLHPKGPPNQGAKPSSGDGVPTRTHSIVDHPAKPIETVGRAQMVHPSEPSALTDPRARKDVKEASSQAGTRTREVDRRPPTPPKVQSTANHADASLQGTTRPEKQRVHTLEAGSRNDDDGVSPLNQQASGLRSVQPRLYSPGLLQSQQSPLPSASLSLRRSYANEQILDVDSISSSGSTKRKRASDERSSPTIESTAPTFRGVKAENRVADTARLQPPSHPRRLMTPLAEKSEENIVLQRPKRYKSPQGTVYYREATPPFPKTHPVKPVADGKFPQSDERRSNVSHQHQISKDLPVLEPVPISAEQLRRLSIFDEETASLSHAVPTGSQRDQSYEEELDDQVVEMVEVVQAPEYVEATDGKIYQVKRKPKLVPVLRRSASGIIRKRQVSNSPRRMLPTQLPLRRTVASARMPPDLRTRARATSILRNLNRPQEEDGSFIQYVAVRTSRPVSRAMTIDDMVENVPASPRARLSSAQPIRRQSILSPREPATTSFSGVSSRPSILSHAYADMAPPARRVVQRVRPVGQHLLPEANDDGFIIRNRIATYNADERIQHDDSNTDSPVFSPMADSRQPPSKRYGPSLPRQAPRSVSSGYRVPDFGDHNYVEVRGRGEVDQQAQYQYHSRADEGPRYEEEMLVDDGLEVGEQQMLYEVEPEVMERGFRYV